MSPQFGKLYSDVGRPSIAPERLLRALLLQIFYSVRSERLLMEQLDYNLLFRWFVGMNMDEPVWVATVFSKNRDRLLKHSIAESFFQRVLKVAQPYLSDEHFTVDGTLIEAWASQKSFQRKDGGSEDGENFHGDRRSNQTHESKTDPDAKLYRKSSGSEARLSYLGHTLVENHSGLIVGTYLPKPMDTPSEMRRWMAYQKRRKSNKPMTLGADKAYDTKDFVAALRDLKIMPHVTQNDRNRKSAIDGRTTRHTSYQISQAKRYWVEEPFGWMKSVGPLRKVKLRGRDKLWWLFTFTAAAFNLWRIPKLQAAAC